jgi:8-oxo-dGTP pyrophosphatase MutT (NUDIX family)
MPNRKRQVAALPVRLGKQSRIEVMLVTSRNSGRWLPPKGNEISGKSRPRCAEIEALEEAGVSGAITRTPLGRYLLGISTRRRRRVQIDVILYPLIMTEVHKCWKEQPERKRRWFSLKKAAQSVFEPELQAILLALRSNEKLEKRLR